ncbi:double-strand break repair helicase AddA [Caulobacter sp. 17J80-11]|uniref:double-strand break repair helicase AddA n=1 Tax=Caulobacter sp. 17J80-11 TaxID=2763502 RepID=UPI001653C279|nr:double-strand break repair helicase AddA [Caulobacter sp. 17J80-11]MBC6981606.1 double-strand break repair helicase AddA [Caulobacter sp. 17J80-11]
MSKPHSPQTQAADPSLSVFVTANAGSGKTSTLVSRVARLLLRGVDPAAILCMTYTKAAAAEMQRRLYQRLGGWSVLPDAELQKELAKLDESEPARFDAAMLSQARALFARALETPGGLKIQTIHAFCEKLLRRFPLEAGVSPRFKVLEDAAAAEVSAEARDDVARLALAEPGGLVGRAYAHFAVELDGGAFEGLFGAIENKRADFQAWFDESGGPGAAVERIWKACGFDQPVEPEAVETDTFAAIDWNAWRRVVDAMAEGSAQDQKCADKMRTLAEAAEGGSFDFAKLVDVFCTAAGEPRKKLATKSVAPWAGDWLVGEQGRICEALASLRAARVGRDSAYVAALAYAYLTLYATAKAASGGLDFADLIARTRDLLVDRADAAWVLYKLDGGVEHVLVDEAQDTAPEQWDIVQALTAEFFAGDGSARDERLLARSIFAVGDEKQSIYSFQGARPERLAQELENYQTIVRGAGGAFEPVPLLKSWRSTPEVLAFVDATFAAEAARALSPLKGEAPVHVAARKDHAGCVDLWPLFKDEPAEKAEAWDAPVDAEPKESARKRLARRMAEEIAGLIARGEAVHDKDENRWRAANAGDVLILVRRRDALFEEIIRALKQKGVPVAGADRLKLSSHIAFDDLIGLGRFLLFPDDDLTLAALLRSPFCDVDEQSLYDLAYCRKGGLWRTLRERAGARPEWAAAADLLAWATEAEAGRTPFDFYSRFLNRLDAQGRSMRARVLERLGREAEEAVDEFLAQVLNAEQRGAAAMETVVAALEQAEVEVKREMEGAHGEVRVMTVHGAKGLEAPIVFLPDTTVKATAQGAPLFRTPDGVFLWAPRKDDDCEASAEARRLRDDRIDDESQRLLYVALTRARDRIVVCGRVAAKRTPAEGSWWDLCSRAYDHDSVDARAVALSDGMEITRFGPDPVTASAEAAKAAAAHLLPGWTCRIATPEALPRWASPTSLVEDVGRAPAPSPLSARGGLGRFRRGELIHKLFQILPDIAPAARAEAAERLLAREPGLSDDQRSEMAAAAFAVLEDPKFAAVFGPGSRAEVAIAGKSPELKAGLAISGRLDRLVVTPDRVLVVDYKTNRPAPDRAEDADPSYLAQMAVYAAVLRTIYPGRSVEAALVWTDGAKLTPLSAELLDATLAALRAA